MREEIKEGGFCGYSFNFSFIFSELGVFGEF